MELTPHRQRWLKNLEVVANSTAKDLDALAMGNLNGTWMNYSLGTEYRNTAIEKLDFLVAYKSGIISDLEDIRSRAFVDNTGALSSALRTTSFDKSILLEETDDRGGGAFRLAHYQELPNHTFQYPENKDIILYVSGHQFNTFVLGPNPYSAPVGLQKYDPEGFGILYVLPEARDLGGNEFNSHSYAIWEDGRLGSFGEPELVPLLPPRYPFFDKDRNKETWIDKYSRLFYQKLYGVAFLLNPAMLDEGRNKDPLYGNAPISRDRGPWIQVFDNREDLPEWNP